MADLLEKLKKNDRDAWAGFYNAHANAIYRYAMFRNGKDVAVAEEITQQTFLTAVDRIDSFVGNTDKLPGWLFGIARIELLRHFRSRDPILGTAVNLDEIAVVGAMPEEGIAPEVYADSAEDSLIDKVLEEMPEMQGRVLQLKYCEELSVEEISIQTGRTAKSIESLLARARAAFQKLYRRFSREMERGDGK